ncbi:protein SON isoform X2 [Antennarius striatus]|uniref:protein SON isoform X2 n=1 Tax=Antennarius striatus TaxID=241820 RepID=UPI0035B18335
MAADLEQIFKDFILNKIKQIEDQNEDKTAADEVLAGIEKGTVGAEEAVSDKDKQPDVKDCGSQKKHKKHKKHKSNKKKKCKEKDKEKENPSEAEGGSKHQLRPGEPADGKVQQDDHKSRSHTGKKKKKKKKKKDEEKPSDSDSEFTSKQKDSKRGQSSSPRRQEELPDIIPKQDTSSRGRGEEERNESGSCHSCTQSHSCLQSHSCSEGSNSHPQSNHHQRRSRTRSASPRTRSSSQDKKTPPDESTPTTESPSKIIHLPQMEPDPPLKDVQERLLLPESRAEQQSPETSEKPTENKEEKTEETTNKAAKKRRKRSSSPQKKKDAKSSKRQKRLKSPSRSHRKRSRPRSPAKKKRSRSRSPAKKKRSRSRSPAKKKRSRSRSPTKKKRSRSRSTNKKRSRSRSTADKKRSRSRSPTKKKRSRSRSTADKKRSRSRSPTKKKRSRSRSTNKKRSRSRSTADKKRSRSRSTADKKRSRSRSNADKKRSRSRSPAKKERSRSRSTADKKRSRSRSTADKKRSRSRSNADKKRSISRSPAKKERSRSRSTNRKKSRSRSTADKKRSRSRSVAKKKRSRSRSTNKKRSRSRSTNKKRSRSRSTNKKRSRSRSTNKKRSRSRSVAKKKRSRSRSTNRKKSRSRSIAKKKRSRSRSTSKKKRSRSRSGSRRSRRSRSRSKSRSRRRATYSQRDRWRREPSHSPVLILRKNRSPSWKQSSSSNSSQRISELDKEQLLEIAKANAAAMCVKAGMPVPPGLRSSVLPMALPTMAMNAAVASMTAATMTAALSNMGAISSLMPLPSITNKPPSAGAQSNLSALEEMKKKVLKQANSISIKEFTDKCKMIVDSKGELPVAMPHVSDEEDDEKPFGGSALREQKAISFSINNTTVRPAVRSDAGMAKEFPVSSGSQHRKKEGDALGCYGEWVPVEKAADPAAATSRQANATVTVATAASSSEVVEEPTYVPENDSVFPDPPAQPVDISQAVSERIKAQRRLAENPYDVNAICMLSRAQEQVDAWAQSNTVPGLFTGSTGAQVLSSEELSTSGPQAWLKKDQFLRAAPVSGGVGEFLMRKMGWRFGEGLGRNREGTVEPIVIDFKVDRKGLVAEGEKPQKQTGGLVVTKDLMGKHPVSALIELCNKRRIMQPDFVMVHHSGPDHRKNFLFKVTVKGVDYQPQTPSPNKKHAKAMAATVALQALGEVPADGPGLYTGPVFTAASTGPLFST